MEVKAKVVCFAGAERSEITASPIALIGGRNEAGKTSTLTGIAAALARAPIPFIEGRASYGENKPVITKTFAKGVVRDGSKSGYATVSTDEGGVTVSWPDGDVSSQGVPPSMSIYASGLVNFSILDEKAKRGVISSSWLDATATKKDLEDHLMDVRYGDDEEIIAVAEAQFKAASDKGWDAQHKVCSDAGAELKAKWGLITGAKYGAKVGESWSPEIVADAGDVEALGNEQIELIGKIENLRRAMAVDDDMRQRLQGIVDQDKPNVQGADLAVTAAMSELEKAKDHLKSLPSDPKDTIQPCPECKAKLGVEVTDKGGLLLTKASTLTPTEVKEIRLNIASAEGKVEHIKGALTKAKRELEKRKTNAEEIKSAKERLASAGDADGRDLNADLAQHVARLDDVNARLDGATKKVNALRIHREIAKNNLVILAMAPGGARNKKMIRALAPFNASCHALCALAHWDPITISPDLIVTMGGRHYFLLSSSAKWRCDVIIRMAMAIGDGSCGAIIDAADILIPDRIKEMFTILGGFSKVAGRDMVSFVSITRDKKEKVPNISKFGLGTSYWIDGGISEVVADG